MLIRYSRLAWTGNHRPYYGFLGASLTDKAVHHDILGSHSYRERSQKQRNQIFPKVGKHLLILGDPDGGINVDTMHSQLPAPMFGTRIYDNPYR